MKSRYLVLQIDIGAGTQWGDSKTINPIRNIFIPSVKKYCKKFQYDYSVITESTYEKKYGQFDFLATRTKHYSFERYFHFDNDYDFTIYIDNDVYIYSDAEPFPDFTGLGNVREPEGNSSSIFRKAYGLDYNIGYFNSGVTFTDKQTAKKLADYMIDRLKKKLEQKEKTLTICC